MAHSSKNRSNKKSLSPLPARLDDNRLKLLYSTMLRARMMAERLKKLEPQITRGSLPEAGHEAIAAGMLIDLRAQDCIAPAIHAASSRLICGEPLKLVIADLLGCKRPQPSSRTAPHPPDRVVSSNLTPSAQLHIALGAAWAFKAQSVDRVAVSLCREESMPADVWHAAVNFSIAHKLAVIHVIQSPSSEPRLPADDSRLPVLALDGDDVIAVYRVGQEAIRRARQGRGPVLLHCQTGIGARFVGDHLGSGRQPAPDPISRMETYLQQKALWSEKWKLGLAARFACELVRAVESAEKLRLRLLPADDSPDSLLAGAG
ncbi:MAG TPA: thiamine pyrophosphate-dependent enzyme [Candidatus Angelobacter sp.]|nr:thiamine pyrophosphate-dependent enzyme [Candidatus Angelobacter sp.]